MKVFISISIALMLFTCCSSGESLAKRHTNSNEKKLLIHSSLLSSYSEFVAEDGVEFDAYYQDRNTYIKRYKSANSNGDTLRVSTLHDVNTCGEIIGMISVSNDTILLRTKNISNYGCLSTQFEKFYYTIVLENIEGYTIVY